MTQVEEDMISGSSLVSFDMKLEVVVIPVSDVDRAKEFYERVGWRLDADFQFDNGFRVVQFTPPGLRLLNTVQHEGYPGRSGLGTKHIPGRLGHRPCA
jgi:catechol 2,3-dioxygenase-like lactoylglutathione lyase family enzyme